MSTMGDLGFGVAGSLDRGVIALIAQRLEAEGFRTLWINDTPDGDSLAGLAAAAAVTTMLRLGTGVISIDRRPPEEIMRSVRQLGLPEDRLTIGIGGAAPPMPLKRVSNALAELNNGLTCRLMVGALGPKMRRLGARESDGLLLNWLTPNAARAVVDAAQNDIADMPVGHVETCLYIRTAMGSGARARLEAEAERYQQIPSYAANFTRMDVNAIETTVYGTSTKEIRDGLARYSGLLDEVVVRAITASDTADEYLELIDATVG